jgi:cytosine/adenosine deaminase-related metal-dependent hydrolase
MNGPGFVNAHTHVYSGLAPLGMPEPVPPPGNFLQILARVWWRLDRALDEPTLRAAARYYVATALLHGTTVLVDHHESPAFIEGSLDVVADACQDLGMRAALCYGATERNAGRDEARRGLAECRRFIRSNRRPLVRGLVGLHASFTVSDDTIREAGELCRELNSVMHVHVAEDAADVLDSRRRGYAGPFERLEALGALPAGSILAHGVHLDADEVRRAESLGCWIVQNPRSNTHNGVGYPRALAASARVAVGTDGFVSDLGDELDELERAAAAHGESPGSVAARAAAGVSLAAELWGIAPGSAEGPDFLGVRATGAGGAQHLSIGGRIVVDHGELRTGDMATIDAAARAAAASLWRRMAVL